MKKHILAAGVAGALLAASGAVIATPQQDATSPVTTRPQPLAGQAAAPTNDSTLQCSYSACGTNVGGSSTVTLGSASPPPSGPPPGGPGLTCEPGQTTLQKQSGGSCPAGTAAYTPYGGNNFLFTQTQTRTESCPAGIYGAPSYTYSGWVPATATAPGGCGTPMFSSQTLRVEGCTETGVNYFSRPMCGFAPARGSFSGYATWNGQSVWVTLTNDMRTGCNASGGDVCENQSTLTVGGVSWVFQLITSGLFRGDYYCAQGAPVCSAPGAAQVSAGAR
ncbi:MAG: hypothetical protein EPN36_12115 [Rhodanobacteraceae bacterium]|nr:MAG: hypothetical protein EPN36_12115 [Rhodanobacteraceae bacterium]